MAGKLTSVFCKTAPIGKHSDGGGLYLHVTAKGKYWRGAYRFEGKQKTAAYGTFPAISLAEARSSHALFKQQLAQKIDPNAEKKTAKERAERDKEDLAKTVAAVSAAWLADTNRAAQWAESTYKQNTGVIKRYLLPAFGKRPISGITALELAECVKAIEEQGKNAAAHKTLSVIKAVFDYAVMLEYLPASPAASLKKIIPPERNAPMRHVTDKEEIGRALVALDRALAFPQAKTFLTLQPLLFLRPNELLQAKWADIDGDTLTIPAERVKTRKAHITPLPRQALAALEQLRPYTERFGYIFYNPSTGKPLSREAALKQYERNGINTTSHGWRHCASTLLNEKGFDKDLIEKQLSHKGGDSTRATYNHAQYLERRREMLQAWADILDELKAKALEIMNLTQQQESEI